MVFWDSAAMALAQDAKNNAVRAELVAREVSLVFHSHAEECAKSWERLDRNMARSEEARANDMREWREDLGRRLDRQDKIQFSALFGVAMTLLSALGFMIAHLNIFHSP